MRQSTAEILKVRPVISVEALPDLRAHIRQVESVVHGVLAPFRVCGGHLVSSIVAAAEIVFQLAPELLGYGRVFEEDAVFAVAV